MFVLADNVIAVLLQLLPLDKANSAPSDILEVGNGLTVTETVPLDGLVQPKLLVAITL